MLITKAVELLGLYAKCPKCNSEYIGVGDGSLEITNDTFRRTCKCGWTVEVREGEAT